MRHSAVADTEKLVLQNPLWKIFNNTAQHAHWNCHK